MIFIRNSIYILLLAIVLSFSGFIIAGAKKNGVEYLFIETSGIGTLHYNDDKKEYKITLSQVDPWVIYFSNVPHRETNFTRTDDFIKSFQKEMLMTKKKGLNAGLIALDIDEEKTVRYTFTLEKPSYNPTTHIVTYTAHILPGKQTSPIPSDVNLKHVALFIDACASCGGSGF